MLSHFEQLVGIPADDSMLQPAPAPLYDARNDHRLGHAQLLGQSLATHAIAVEKVAYECANSTGVGGRSKGQEQKWVVECCVYQSVSDKHSVVRDTQSRTKMA